MLPAGRRRLQPAVQVSVCPTTCNGGLESEQRAGPARRCVRSGKAPRRCVRVALTAGFHPPSSRAACYRYALYSEGCEYFVAPTTITSRVWIAHAKSVAREGRVGVARRAPHTAPPGGRAR